MPRWDESGIPAAIDKVVAEEVAKVVAEEDRREARGRPTTLPELQALLPGAAIEEKSDGELVIYTGLAVDENGHLILWEEEQ